MSGSVHDVATEVLAEALEQARVDAVAELRRILAAELVESARRLMEQDRPDARTPERCPPPAATDPAPAGRGWYVYGLTWEQVARNLSGRKGIAGSVVEALPVGPVAAVGGWVDVAACRWGADGADADVEALAPRLHEHEQVLEAVLDAGPVLPMKFGRVYQHLDGLEESLRRDGEAIGAALRRLEGRAEWGLTLEWDPAAAGSLEEAGPDGPPGGYLARRRTEICRTGAAERAAREEAGRVHASLSRLADGEVLHPVRSRKAASRPAVLRASYLVAHRDADAFRRAAAEALASAPDALRMTGEITGPWPPYNFSELDGRGVPA